MKLKSYLLGLRELESKENIIHYIAKSSGFDSSKESADNMNALLIFNTSKQHTWLIATSEKLYCVLDDVRRDSPKLQWIISKDKIISNGRMVINISAHDKNDRTGVINFGDEHSGWLYSKSLFTSITIEEAIERLIFEQMA